MAEDTRRDRRVKIVSLNVRYKSATVDEFIENHSYDVSRGGIFVKTTSPFASGTLLKFEIRLADDQSVMSGVGRVVWRRDATNATAESPPGMGVKFIKLDDESKAVIERIVKRDDSGRGFEAEVVTAPSVAEIVAASTSLGPEPQAAKPAPAPPGPAPAPPAGPHPPPPPPQPGRKATAVGLGAVKIDGPPPPPVMMQSPPRAATSSPPASNMFPDLAALAGADEPKNEPTVMRQAAEFLEEALKEAGGKIDDFGTNPVFAQGTPSPGAVAERGRGPASKESRPPSVVVSPTETLADSPQAHQARRIEVTRPSSRPAAKGREPSETPPAKPVLSSRPVAAAPANAAQKSGGMWKVVGVVLVVAIGGGVFLFKDSLFAPPPAPVRPPVNTAAGEERAKAPATATESQVSPTPAPAATTAAPANASGVSAASSTSSAAGSAGAPPVSTPKALGTSGSVSPPTAARPPTAPQSPDLPTTSRPVVPPPQTPAAPTTAIAKPTPVAPPAPPTVAAPPPVAAPKPAAPPPTQTVQPVQKEAAAPPKPAPAAKPKPAKPKDDTDNPY